MMTDAFDPDFASPADWVIAYRALLLNVIPATEKKHPVVNWKEFQQGLVPAAVFDRWYGPDGEYSRSYSMGFLTGPASLPEGEALLGIDCDAKEIDGRLTWQGWLDVHENGLEPETWKARTGSGGRHIFFRYPSSITIRNAQGKYRGIDVRAEGGFIMAAPSAHYIRGTHYEWEEGCDPLQGAQLADAPPWLIQMCQDMQEAPRAEAGERVEASGSYDAWGNRTDGREAYMRDVVWASVLDLYRACPIRPGEDESLAAMQRAYEAYARNVRSRFPGDNEVGLEREGRGLSLFQVKWDMAMRQWDRKVSEEAARPRPERPFEAGPAQPDPPPEVKTTDIRLFRFADLITQDVPEEPDYVGPDLLVPGSFLLIGGPPKAQKSWLLQTLLMVCATGGQFLDHFRVERPLRVFWLQAEMNEKLLRRRAKAVKDLTPTKLEALGSNMIVSDRFRMILSDDGARRAAALMQTAFGGEPPDIIAFDPMANLFDQENENDNAQVMKFLTQRVELVRQLVNPLAAVVLVHHATKKGPDEIRRDPFNCFRGGGALRGHYDSGIIIFRQSEEGEAREAHFELRGGESPERMVLRLIDGRMQRVEETPQTGPSTNDFDFIVREIDARWKAGSPFAIGAKAGRLTLDQWLIQAMGKNRNQALQIVEKLVGIEAIEAAPFSRASRGKGWKVLKWAL